MLNYKIKDQTKLRLDQYLSALKIAPSRSQLSRWIKEGHVFLNGKKAKPAEKLKPGDDIVVFPPEIKAGFVPPENIPLSILYEDEALLVLNKEPGIVVHPGAGHHQGTLVHALLHHCGGLSHIGGVERPGLVHRLDKGTSGAMVVAKTDAAHLGVSRQLKDHQFKKIYWALVYGSFKKEKGTIETYLSRSSSNRKKYSVSSTKGKKAVTHYHVLKEEKGISLVEIQLETGRTHQIRVHMTDGGHSLLGDEIYGSHESRLKQMKDKNLKTQLQTVGHPLLHAKILGFEHPIKKKWMEFEAPLPKDFLEVLKLM